MANDWTPPEDAIEVEEKSSFTPPSDAIIVEEPKKKSSLEVYTQPSEPTYTQPKESASEIPSISTEIIEPKRSVFDVPIFQTQKTDVVSYALPNEIKELQSQKIRNKENEDWNKLTVEQQKDIESRARGEKVPKFTSTLNSFNQRLFDIAGAIPIGIAVMAEKMDKSLFGKDQDVRDYATYTLGDFIQGLGKELFPTNPAYQDELSSQLMSAGADILSFVTTGGVAKGLGMSSTGAMATMGGFQSAVPEYQQTVELTQNANKLTEEEYVQKFAQNEEDIPRARAQYNQIKGKDPEQVGWEVFLRNGVIGTTEALPIQLSLNRITKIAEKSGKKIIPIIVEAMKSGSTEAMQEMSTQYFSNLTAQEIYDQQRKWYDGLKDAGTVGFITGGVLAGAATAIQSKIINAKSPEEIAILKAAYNDIKQKEAEQTGRDFAVEQTPIENKIIEKLKKQKDEIAIKISDKNISPETRDMLHNESESISAKIEEEKFNELDKRSKEKINGDVLSILQEEKNMLEKDFDNLPSFAKKPAQERIDEVDMLINKYSGKIEVKGAKPLEEITALAEKVAKGEKVEEGEMQLFKDYAEDINKEVDRIKGQKKPSEAVGETKVEPKPTVEPVSPSVVASETKPEPKVVAKPQDIEPIRQLGTGANVYFEVDKYRVNDSTKDGKVLLNIGDAKGEVPLANIEFDNANEAVFVAKKLQENAPNGIDAEFHNIDKIIENYKKEYSESLLSKEQPIAKGKNEPTPTETKVVSPTKEEVAPEDVGQKVSKGEIRTEPAKTEDVGYKEHLTKDGKYLVENKEGKVTIYNSETGKEVTPSKQHDKIIKEYVDANLEKFKEGEKAELGEGVTEADVPNIVLEKSKNPEEIAQTWLNSRNNIDRGSITFEDAVNEAATDISIDAFKRHTGYGAKDVLPKLKKRLTKDGLPLDSVAERVRESMGEDAVHMDEGAFIEKIVDYINSKEFEEYKPNKETQIEIDLNRKFQDITGLPLTEATAKQIADYKGAMERIADKIDDVIGKIGSGEFTFGSFIPPQILQIGLQEVATLLRAGIALKRAVNLAIRKMSKAMGEGKFGEKEREEFIIGIKEKIQEQKTALKEAEKINVPTKPSEIKKAVKEITKPTQEEITISKKEALKKQLRDISKGAKIGFREGKLTEKEVEKGRQAFKDEAIEFINKSEVLDKNQKSVLKSKAKDIKTFPQLDRFFDYADKIIDDVAYANEVMQAKANKSKFKDASLKSFPANYREVVKHMGQLPLDYVDVKKYNEVANNIKDGLKPVTSENYKPLDYNDAINKIDELRKEADETQRKELLEEIGGGDFTLAELKDIMSGDIDQFAGNLSEAKQKTLHDNMVRHGEYAQMGIESAEHIPKTPSEAKDLSALRKIDVSKLTNKELMDFILTTDNIITNGRFDGSSIFSAIQNMQEGYSQLKTKKVKIATVNELGMQVFSLPLMLRKIFGNDKYSAQVRASSGMEEVIQGNTKTAREMDRVQDEHNKLIKTVKGKNKNILDYDNNIFRGVVSDLIQSKTSDPVQMNKELQLRKGYVEQTIQALRDAGETKAAETHQKAYDGVKDYTTQEQILDAVKERNDGNYEVINFWLDNFGKNKSSLKENTERVHNELFEEIDNNYLPTKNKKIIGQEEIKLDSKRPFYNTDVARNEKQAPTTVKRTYFKKLKDNTIRDYEFDKVMFDRYEKSIFDVNVSGAVQKFKTFMDAKDAINVFGNADNIKIINKKFNNMMDSYMHMGSHTPEYLKTFADIERVVRKTGAIQALGGIGQTIKQPMVMINTAFNLGKDAGLLFKSIPKDLQIIKDNTIGLRGKALAGIERGETLSKSEQARITGILSKSIRGFEKLTEPVKNVFFYALKTLDVASAERSWVAYYLKSLKESGIKDVDLSKEHLLAEDPIRKRAISYAEQKIGSTQVVSDAAQQAEIFKQDHKIVKTIFRNIIAPFSTFPATAKGRMILDLDNIRKGRDAGESLKSLAGTITEMVAFHAVSTFVIGTLRDEGEEALYWMFDIPTKDKTEKEKKDALDFKFKKWYSNILGDVVGGGFTQAAQNATIDGANKVAWYMESLMSDKKEVPYSDWKKKNAPFWRYEAGDNQKLGIYSIPLEAAERINEGYSLAFDEEKITTQKYNFDKESKKGLVTKTSIETEKPIELSKEEESFMQFSFLMDLLNSSGLSDADLYRTIQQAKRNILKKRLKQDDKDGE